MPVVEKIGEVWRCDICGNIVEVKEIGGGELLCCGGPMTKLNKKDTERREKEKESSKN